MGYDPPRVGRSGDPLVPSERFDPFSFVILYTHIFPELYDMATPQLLRNLRSRIHDSFGPRVERAYVVNGPVMINRERFRRYAVILAYGMRWKLDDLINWLEEDHAKPKANAKAKAKSAPKAKKAGTKTVKK